MAADTPSPTSSTSPVVRPDAYNASGGAGEMQSAGTCSDSKKQAAARSRWVRDERGASVSSTCTAIGVDTKYMSNLPYNGSTAHGMLVRVGSEACARGLLVHVGPQPLHVAPVVDDAVADGVAQRQRAAVLLSTRTHKPAPTRICSWRCVYEWRSGGANSNIRTAVAASDFESTDSYAYDVTTALKAWMPNLRISHQSAASHDAVVLGPPHVASEDGLGLVLAGKASLDEATAVVNHNGLA